MSEIGIIHDPFTGKNGEISERLTDRLRGKYAIGPMLANGEPEFGWTAHETAPIMHEAAGRLEALTAERDALKAENEWLQDEQSTVDHWSLGYRAGWEDGKAGKPQTDTLPSIGSAPKTGECVLGICMEAQTPGWRLTWWDGGWVVVGKPEKFSSIPARWWPTHWLPLPDVPPKPPATP